ncbi:hypothetical protein HY772_08170, partial [Candidatus Woesearchaeota archaeon]|nr:hypothetical protein [Candidatus Woesearchaeota archaeon]
MYDSGVFWGEAEPQKRVKLFEDQVAGYLKAAESPVLVLAEQEIAVQFREAVKNAGFAQIDIPYNLNRVLESIDAM